MCFTFTSYSQLFQVRRNQAEDGEDLKDIEITQIERHLISYFCCSIAGCKTKRVKRKFSVLASLVRLFSSHIWYFRMQLQRSSQRAKRSPVIIRNSSNPSSRKHLDVRPYDRPYKVFLLACGANCTMGTILAIT